MLLEFCLKKELFVSNTSFKRVEKRKVTLRMGVNETEIDLVLIKKEHRRSIQNLKAIPWKFQHSLVIAVIDKKKIRKVVKKTCAERRWISLLKDVKIRKQLEEKVFELVDVEVPDLWGHF